VYNVKIYGAGSIGNHLTHGCRTKGWDVLMCDLDQPALERTRDDIYPSRYGQWDPQIRLATPDNLPDEDFDLVIIGTPPDTHMRLAKTILAAKPPKALLIEKPLCTPSLEGAQEIVELQAATGTFVAVGYNHTLTDNSKRAGQILADNIIGQPLTISARFREHWGGIFGAHPWLSGPQDTYLGFFERGGGASGEHSHAMNIWQHFAPGLPVERQNRIRIRRQHCPGCRHRAGPEIGSPAGQSGVYRMAGGSRRRPRCRQILGRPRPGP